MLIRLFFPLIITAVIGSCQTKEAKQLPFKSEKDFQTKIIESHKAHLLKEQKRIKHYTDSLNIPFTQTGTGLNYSIVSTENGDSIFKGDLVAVKYHLLDMLTNDTLYETAKNEYQEFVVDFDDVESGLHEGIKKLKVGDSAILVLPAHLGHGITGDQMEIPSQATLVYFLKLYRKK